MGNALWRRYCCDEGQDNDNRGGGGDDIYGGGDGDDQYACYYPAPWRPPPAPHGVAVASSSANISSRIILRPEKQSPPPHGVAAASSASPTPARSSLLRFEHDLLDSVLSSLRLPQPQPAPASRPQWHAPPPVPHGAVASSASTSRSSLLRPQQPAPASRPQWHAPPPVPHGAVASSASTSRSNLLRPQQPAPAAAPVSRRKQRRQRPPAPHGVAVVSPANTSSRMIFRPKKQNPPPQPPLASHGVAAASSASPTPARSSFLRFEHDILNFVHTKMVPQGLGEHVTSSKKAQAKWYRNISKAYVKTEPLPTTSAEAAMLIATSLSRIQGANLEGILAFYGFAIPAPPVVTKEHLSSSLPDGVQYVLKTLPVDAKGIGDGDGFTAYVDTEDPMESTNVPLEVHEAVTAMAQSRKRRNNQNKNVLQNKLDKAGYGIMNTSKDVILAKQYRIRLRGIDAPEMGMQYGKESQNALVKLIAGKSVMVYIYGQDKYNRYVGDIYCDGVFIQEQMLKEGHAWHYKIYDKRPEFAKWEKKARHARRGLWTYDNPETPWDWKRSRGIGK